MNALIMKLHKGIIVPDMAPSVHVWKIYTSFVLFVLILWAKIK
jgi:hypothetical protein